MIDRYDFKLYISNTDILAFRALVVNKKSYHIISVEGFGIDDVYKKLFLRIIKGDLTLKYFDKTKFSDNNVPKSEFININRDDAIENIELAKKMNESLLGVKIVCEPMEMYEMLSFRFVGHDLNIGHGVLPKNVNKINNIVDDLISIVSANNTNFGEVLQLNTKASSTLIPFISERIDTIAIDTIKKIIEDLKNGSIDITFMRTSDLYKKFIKKLKQLISINDLKEFEIIINGEKYGLYCFDILSNIDVYNEQVSGRATIRYYKGALKSRPNRHVIVVEKNGKDLLLHFDAQSDNFENFHRIAQKSGMLIDYGGFTESEEVVFIDKLNKSINS